MKINKKGRESQTLREKRLKMNHTWGLFEETEIVLWLLWSSSCKPRNSRALVPESTVVTAMERYKNREFHNQCYIRNNDTHEYNLCSELFCCESVFYIWPQR